MFALDTENGLLKYIVSFGFNADIVLTNRLLIVENDIVECG
jgi:hypothetical protein